MNSSSFFLNQDFHSVRKVREFVRGSRNVREFVRGSGKVREIRNFLEKVREENFYPRNFITSIKNKLHAEKCVFECQLNCIRQSVLYMMLLFASSIKMI